MRICGKIGSRWRRYCFFCNHLVGLFRWIVLSPSPNLVLLSFLVTTSLSFLYFSFGKMLNYHPLWDISRTILIKLWLPWFPSRRKTPSASLALVTSIVLCIQRERINKQPVFIYTFVFFLSFFLSFYSYDLHASRFPRNPHQTAEGEVWEEQTGGGWCLG